MTIFNIVLTIIISAFFLVESCEVASAAVYKVEIQQEGIETEIFTALCDEQNGACFRTIQIFPEFDDNRIENRNLDIGILFVQGAVRFQFMWMGRLLSISGTDKDSIDFSLPVEGFKNQLVKLYVPNSLAEQDERQSTIPLVIRMPGNLVAKLNISVRPK